MLEQELVGIIRYVKETAGKPNCYYYEVKEGFDTPAAFFPRPIVKTYGDTFNSYRVRYLWYIKFFADDTPEAYDMAFDVLTAIRRNKNWVPIGDDSIWIRDPELRTIEPGVAQLTLSWDLRRPFSEEEHEKTERILIKLNEVEYG